MNLSPTQDYVMVLITNEEKTRDSGIVIPDVATVTPQRGKIVKVGPDCKESTLEMLNKRVWIGQYNSGQNIEQSDYWMMREEFIIGVEE